MNALPLSRKATRAALGALLLAFALMMPGACLADDPVKGEINVSTENGFTRLVFRLDDVVEAQARMSGAPVSFLTLLSMRLRRVPISLVVQSRITAVKAGIPLETDQLEAHYLAGGDVNQVVRALIAKLPERRPPGAPPPAR